MLVMQSVKAAAYPFRPTAKTATDQALARSQKTKPFAIPLPPVQAMWSGLHWLILCQWAGKIIRQAFSDQFGSFDRGPFSRWRGGSPAVVFPTTRVDQRRQSEKGPGSLDGYRL